MSAYNVQSKDCAGSAQLSLTRAQRLLEEALQIIDEHAEKPEIGARLQEVIDSVGSLTG